MRHERADMMTEMMITLLTFYLLLVGIFVWFMTRVERSLRVPGFGQ